MEWTSFTFAIGKYQFDFFQVPEQTYQSFVEGSYRYENYSLSNDEL
ncbi:MAG: hypothetical protein IPN72_17720 [Saprospiraceae bacterium]|nr:hypothetical protein [Saprospiraceae bacterium]